MTDAALPLLIVKPIFNYIFMKTRFFLPALLIFALFAVSCSNDTDDDFSLDKYWIDIVTVENPNNNNVFFMRQDNNTLLWTAATNFPGYRPKDGQRIIANFTKLADKRLTDLYDYDVKLNDVYEVLTKGIFLITPQKQDSIGNDPIKILDMWIGRHYLNIEFSYWGYNKVHYINLVSDVEKTYSDGKIHLEFRHNANNDDKIYNKWGMVSFDLSSLIAEHAGEETIPLVIHVNESGSSQEKTYELTISNSTATASAPHLISFPESTEMLE